MAFKAPWDIKMGDRVMLLPFEDDEYIKKFVDLTKPLYRVDHGWREDTDCWVGNEGIDRTVCIHRSFVKRYGSIYLGGE